MVYKKQVCFWNSWVYLKVVFLTLPPSTIKCNPGESLQKSLPTYTLGLRSPISFSYVFSARYATPKLIYEISSSNQLLKVSFSYDTKKEIQELM